jgi:thioredoxin-like negative regulator of GroEL
MAVVLPVACQYEVRAYPTLRVFKRGEPADVYQGPRKAKFMADHVETALRKLNAPNPSEEMVRMRFVFCFGPPEILSLFLLLYV